MKNDFKIKIVHFVAILFLVGLLIFPAITPLFKKDFFKMHDFTHVARLVELDLALKDGHFPARWSKNLGWGFGMPLFQFYAPLPYYLSEAFHFLGASFVVSIKICFGLSFFISFLGMFVLAKKFWGKWGGFLAGLVFVYSPYRAVDFYVRGALGELFAIGLIPWVLWAITGVIDKKTKKWIGLCSLLLAFFLLSHTILNLICFPLFLLFAGFYLLISCCKKSFAASFFRITIAIALAIGASSFFLMPAFFEKKFAQVEKLISGFSHYSHHFLYFRQFIWGTWGYGGSVDGIEDGLSFHLGKIHLGLAGLTLGFCLISIILKKKLEKKNLIAAFFILLSLILAFLSTYHAKPIWDVLPIMAFIQFPWRFNSFIIVLIAFLAGGVIFYLKKFSKNLAFIFMFVSIFLLLKTNLKYFKPEKYITPSDYYYTDQQLIKKNMSDIIPDYIPIWVKNNPEEIAKSQYQVISGDAKVEILESKTHKFFIKSTSKEESKIQLNRFYFPGYKVFIDDKKAPFEYKETNGVITVSVPPGEHILKLVFTRTSIRIFSEIVSIVSILGILFIFFHKPSLKKLKQARLGKFF